MSSSVDSDSTAVETDDKSVGVQFAESTVGRPIIGGLLFITSSFWLMVASAGVLLTLLGIGIGDGAMAGIIGVFGLSGIFVGLVGYAALLLYVNRQEIRS